MHGPPHHLKVYTDATTADADCGVPIRIVIYEVVDSNGRGAGSVRFRELPSPVPYDTCSGGLVNMALTCTSTPSNGVVDQIRVGCPSLSPSPPCGFTIEPNRIQWCKRNSIYQTLASFNVDASNTYVKINGSEEFPPRHELYP